MIGIVDYGTSNIGSLTNALGRLGIEYSVSGDPDELGRTSRLILPGVGAFAHAMTRLHEQSLESFLRDWAKDGGPIFGICLGMQLLMESSEEHGQHQGLGIVGGKVVALQGGHRKVHMGWNKVSAAGTSSMIGPDNYAYFVHSYVCQPTHTETVAGICNYGGPIAAALQQDSVWGVQFHPEKSGEFGLSILEKFADASF